MSASWQIYLGTYQLGSNVDIDTIECIRNRRITQSSIIRSHLTIIPEGKLQPLNISIQGTLAATTWDTLRTAMQTFQNAVYNGKQKFTIDNERYIKVINSSFSWSLVTQFFARYSVKFIAELPYWLAETPDSDTETPTSGSGYTVNNGGQVRVPCKITITPTGELADDCQFENTTLGLLFKYRGTIAAGKSLVVDMGYDQDNKPTYYVTNDGVSDMANFEGDFMEIDPGDNTFELTGGSNDVQVVIAFRKGYYS